MSHMSAGALSRGTELISIPYRNNSSSRVHRGIFIHNGLVEIVCDYHKGASSGVNKIIHRFVPQEVGQLIVLYLWAVGPFVEMLQSVRERVFKREVTGQGSIMWELKPEAQYQGEGDQEEEEEE